MKRACFLLLALTLISCAEKVKDKTHVDQNKPNIILVMTDDQGYSELSCHDHPVLKTPQIDKLRTQSMSFDQFHVSPTCAPTRSAIMSGRDPFFVGVTHTVLERERMALGVPTLPEMLKDNGYTTGMFGKWHLGDPAPYRPDQRGFDEVFMHGAGGIGQSYPGTCGDAPKNKYFDPYILHNNKFVKTKGFCTDIFFAQTLKWIEKTKDGDKPFFAYLATNAPHGPFLAPDEYKKPFVKAGYKGAQLGYYGMIANIDHNMGKLIAKLDQWKIADNTILIFMSDNGSPGPSTFNGGMKGRKGTVDEGGTRVPFFIRWPGKIKASSRCDKLVRHYDLLPTFAALTGATKIKEEDKLSGKSFNSLLKNSQGSWPDRKVVFHKGRWNPNTKPTKEKGYALKTERWRYVAPNMLFDIQKDPGQKNNVYEQHKDVAASLNKYYDSWWKTALPLMVNEDAEVRGHNTFHLMFWKQFKMPVPKWKYRKGRFSK
jgi:arylsulfatase A-like enzyme